MRGHIVNTGPQIRHADESASQAHGHDTDDAVKGGRFRRGDCSIRERNRAIALRYLHSSTGEALLHRHRLFRHDGVSGLWTSDSGTPVFVRGRDSIARYDVWSSVHFPDWRWYDIRVWTTDDPDRIWAECDGEGTIVLPGHEAVHYGNHFLYSFEMRDGQIAREREFTNPVVEMKALGLTTPTIDLGDFPR